ncbi:MAG: HAD family hydrolase [Desulfuromonadaceae bacterium]|nr:HAD family hydrolase [Desulfuromonadaceae bacterium]
MTEAGLIQGVDALIFDLDDTLYSQESFKRSGFTAVAAWAEQNLAVNRLQCRTMLDLILAEHGPSYPLMFNLLTSKLGLPLPVVDDLVREFINHDPAIDCYPGVKEMLADLRPRYRTGILTDGRLSVQQKKIQALALQGLVDEILYSAELGLEKPDRQLFLWFEERFGLKGRQLVYIGDNPHKDFSGARERGWRTIRVLTGEHADSPCPAGQDAEIMLSSVLDLPSILPSRPQ